MPSSSWWNSAKEKIVFYIIRSEFGIKDNPISIGRSESVNIHIDDHSLSRVQCEIKYIEGKWHLIDGYGGKKSTNGTWLYVDKPFQIYDGMMFKAGMLLFRARIYI